jgi:hypothetical protein
MFKDGNHKSGSILKLEDCISFRESKGKEGGGEEEDASVPWSLHGHFAELPAVLSLQESYSFRRREN